MKKIHRLNVVLDIDYLISVMNKSRFADAIIDTFSSYTNYSKQIDDMIDVIADDKTNVCNSIVSIAHRYDSSIDIDKDYTYLWNDIYYYYVKSRESTPKRVV